MKLQKTFISILCIGQITISTQILKLKTIYPSLQLQERQLFKRYPFYRYGHKDRIVFKKKLGYFGLLDDHHVIPKCFSKHSLIKTTHFDIHSSFNLIILPNIIGKSFLNVNRSIHTNHHFRYNYYIQQNLDFIDQHYDTQDEKKYHLWLFYIHVYTMLLKNKISLY